MRVGPGVPAASQRLSARNRISQRLNCPGRKDHPGVIALAVGRQMNGETLVTVLPITHLPPYNSEAGIEIPQPVKWRLGLEDARSWVIIGETNSFGPATTRENCQELNAPNLASCGRGSFIRSSKPFSPGAATTRFGPFPAIDDRRSMPLGPFVAQFHLRHFYFPALDGEQMHGLCKSDGRIFRRRSNDIRRIESGGANADLANDRAAAKPDAPPHLRQPSPRAGAISVSDGK